ncbi:MAG: enhanced intracellular survival protein Eis [Promethearchaeota archaeon]
MIEVREAREEDRDSAIKVMWKSHEQTTPYRETREADWVKRWHTPENEDWGFVAVDGDRVVALVNFFASENNLIRGQPVRSSCVCGVATDPAYRRRGLIRKIYELAFPAMRERGMVLSILDPFYQLFYEKFGYTLAEKRMKHVFKPEHLRPTKGPSDIEAREIQGLEDLDKLAQVERAMARFGSRLFFPKHLLEKQAKEGDPFGYLLERGSEPVGSVKFWFRKAGEDVAGTVGFTRYTTDDVFPAIVELVYKHLPNIGQATWYTDQDVPVRHFMKYTEDVQSYSIGSMMMRVVDFEGYCRSISVPSSAKASIVVELKDEQCSWNTGKYKLVPNRGRLQIESVDTAADIVLDALQVSKVVSGLIPASVLRAFGEIQCSKAIANTLESIFPEDVFLSYLRF